MRNLFALVVLVLSVFGPGASWAAYCMSTYTIGGRTYFIQGNQPGDPSSCAYIAVSGIEWANYQNAVAVNVTQGNSITALQASDTTQTNNISVLRTDVNTLRTDVNTLRTDVNNQQGTISGYQNSMQTLLNYQASTFDLPTALAAFAFFFSTVIFFYSIAAPAGAILEKIRRPLGRG